MPVVRGGGGHGHAINPTTPNQGHFILSPVSLESRDQDDGQIELKGRHQRSHRKIGDCEQSKLCSNAKAKQMRFKFKSLVKSTLKTVKTKPNHL